MSATWSMQSRLGPEGCWHIRSIGTLTLYIAKTALTYRQHCLCMIMMQWFRCAGLSLCASAGMQVTTTLPTLQGTERFSLNQAYMGRMTV